MAKKMEAINKSLKKFAANRSKDYNRYGKYMIRDCNRDDIPDRVIAYFADLVASVIPIILWDYLFLLVGSGLLSYFIFKIFTKILVVLLCICILLINTYAMIIFKGQSIGKLIFNFKVVKEDGSECDRKTLIIRQLVGFGIPIVILTIIFGIYGFIIFSSLNAIFALVNRKHKSIIDQFTKTKVVKLNAQGIKHTFTIEKEKEKIEPAENLYDLHVYSSFSQDGQYGPEDILKMAQKKGIKALSITDHNSVKANKMAMQVAHLYGIEYIPGICIDCSYENTHVEILGYYIDYNDDRFRQVEYEYVAREKALSTRRIDLFEEATGLKVNCDELLKYNPTQIITPRMVAKQILTRSEYRDSKLLQPYLTGNKKDKPITYFVNDFFNEGGVAYVPSIYPNAKDMISLIKATGGAAVLAHPMVSLKDKDSTFEHLIKEGLDGIELFTPAMSRSDSKFLIRVAKTFHLDTIAGSEFSGKKHPKYVLGKTTCPKDVEEIVVRFINKYKK